MHVGAPFVPQWAEGVAHALARHCAGRVESTSRRIRPVDRPESRFNRCCATANVKAAGTRVQAIQLSPYASCPDGEPLQRFRGHPPYSQQAMVPRPFRGYNPLPGRGQLGGHRASRQPRSSL